MIDSNVVIEYMKNNSEAVNIVNFIRLNPNNRYYLTLDSIEEILYVLVKHFSKNFYWNLKKNPEIAKNTYKKFNPLIKSILKSYFRITLQTENTHNILLLFVKNMDYYLKTLYYLLLEFGNVFSLVCFSKDL